MHSEYLYNILINNKETIELLLLQSILIYTSTTRKNRKENKINRYKLFKVVFLEITGIATGITT